MGALLGAAVGAIRRLPDLGPSAAAGALLGAVGLWAYGVYGLVVALQNLRIPF